MAAAACCAQMLWIRQQLEDFGVKFETVPILCDNSSSVICISKNPVFHSRTKHIEIRHYFLRENVERGLIEMKFCKTEDQVADIFTKPLSKERFERLRFELGMIRIF